MNYPAAPWFVRLKPAPRAKMRLYCFPYAGGGVPVFRTWPDGLSASIEVWAAHLPGRGSRSREAPVRHMLPLVQTLVRQLPADSNQRPFAFFGHSLGARVGFEVARSLRRQGKPLPAQLFVSACPAPQLPSGRPIHMLPKAAFLAELQRRNGIPQEVLAHPELLELLLPMLRADFMVIETAVYRREPPLNFPITAFGGIEDPIVSRGALEAWREQTSGPFNMVFFTGDHFFLRTAEDQLLQAINTTAM
ncbi:MAG: alpha/beta fold hydrolase [Chloroflexi bacterium]|nr:alpha/beta fold hydrolase [Chloroflexota bacterium]